MKKMYLLGEGYGEHDVVQEWPYTILLVINDGKEDSICFCEGKGFGGVGGTVQASKIQEKRYQEHLSISKCKWLPKIMKESVVNGSIDGKYILDSYHYLFGKFPPLVEGN